MVLTKCAKSLSPASLNFSLSIGDVVDFQI